MATGSIKSLMKLDAAERNKGPILEILKLYIKPPEDDAYRLKLLEIASGSGQHISHFAPFFPYVIFQPSELDSDLFEYIEMYCENAKATNILKPMLINVQHHFDEWANGTVKEYNYDFILNINMIHITPWTCTSGLILGASKTLKLNGLLFMYGPFGMNGTITPESNRHFNDGLRQTDPAWGVRDITLDLEPLAQVCGFNLTHIHDLPANNKFLVWQKTRFV